MMLKNRQAPGLILFTAAVSLFLSNAAASPDSDPFPGGHIWPLLEIRESGGGGVTSRPVTQNDLSSPFGSRLLASEDFRYDFHRGIDIPTLRGTPVVAIADGVARLPAGFKDLVIQVEHTKASGQKYRATYTHLDSIPQAILNGIAAAPDGRFPVTQGTVVGYSGEAASGFDHLHFEIRDEGYYQEDCVNPLEVLPWSDSNSMSLQIVEDVNALCDSDNDPGTPMPQQIIDDFENALLTVRVTLPRNTLDFNRLDVSIHDLSQPGSPSVDSQSVDFRQWNHQYSPQADPITQLDDRRFNGVTILPAAFSRGSSTYTVDFIFRELAVPGGTGPVQYVIRGYDLKGNQTELIRDESLPVELTSFSARCEGRSVILAWVTESEVENAGFILERRTEGDLWTEIASWRTHCELTGQGSTSSETRYALKLENDIPGRTCSYRLSDVSLRGEVRVAGVLTITLDAIPGMTVLEPATPNPFNPATRIVYELAEEMEVRLSVVDMTGRTVRVLVSGIHQAAGVYSALWSGKNRESQPAASGVYLLVLEAGGVRKTQKIMLLR